MHYAHGVFFLLQNRFELNAILQRLNRNCLLYLLFSVKQKWEKCMQTTDCNKYGGCFQVVPRDLNPYNLVRELNLSLFLNTLDMVWYFMTFQIKSLDSSYKNIDQPVCLQLAVDVCNKTIVAKLRHAAWPSYVKQHCRHLRVSSQSHPDPVIKILLEVKSETQP